MKYLLVLFIVSASLQPLALQACDMDAEKSSSHHSGIHDTPEPNCCDTESNDPMENCDAVTACGFASLIAPVIPASSGIMLSNLDHHFDFINGNRYSGPPVKPLFRPPIA